MHTPHKHTVFQISKRPFPYLCTRFFAFAHSGFEESLHVGVVDRCKRALLHSFLELIWTHLRGRQAVVRGVEHLREDLRLDFLEVVLLV